MKVLSIINLKAVSYTHLDVYKRQIHNYAAGSRNKVYGWEVADVKEYPQAVTLEELGIKRAPQSWQYMR